MLKHLTKAERNRIEKLIKTRSLSETARIMGRSKNCIITEVRRNGGRDNYNAAQAHEDELTRRFKGVSKAVSTSRSIEERLRSMEMQIDTLTELFKELHDKY